MSAPARPIEHVLAAIDRASLLALIHPEDALMLASPVARAAAGLTLDAESASSAARLLDRNRATLAGPLAHFGLEVPALPRPVPPKETHSAQKQRPVLKVLANGRIGIMSPFALKDVVKGLTGARWDKARTLWTIPASPAAAAEALETLAPWSPAVSPRVTELAEQFAVTLSSRAMLVDGAPLPPGDLTDVITVAGWEHQRRGVAWSEVVNALLFAVPMGGGKTAMALAAVNRRQAHTVLIVCPNTVRGVWPREVREKSAIGWHIEDGTRPPRRRGAERQDLSSPERLERAERLWWACDCGAPVHAFAINYQQMSQPAWKRWRPPHMLDAVIYDEIHNLKSPTGAASKLAMKWVDYFRFRLGLSGTPIPQSPLDAFGVMRALDPGLYGTTWTGFKARYAVMDPTGTFPLSGKIANGKELAEKFMTITYRPKIDLKLPGRTRTERLVRLEPEARKAYAQLDEELWADLTPFLAERAAHGMPSDPTDAAAALRMAVEFENLADGPPSEITTPNVLTRMLRLQQLTGGFLVDDDGNQVRVSRAKGEELRAVLEEYGAGPDEPAVVCCRFTNDLDVVRETAAAMGLRYGEISGRRKDGIDRDSRMNPEVDIVGVQIQAGGTGIDLTRSALAINYSVGYSLANYDQWLARTDRPGQTRVVRYVNLVCQDTMDEHVYEAMNMRRAVISECLRSGGVDPETLGVHEPIPAAAPLDAADGTRVIPAVELPWD